MKNVDEHYLRIAFKEAVRARERGNHAFGGLLVDADGEPVLAAQNSVVTDKDVIAHAEINMVRAASGKFQPEQLKTFTLYVSAEPCPMCAGAIVWANIRRVVFGLGMEGIYELFDAGPDDPTLRMHAARVFAEAPWPMEVIGPMLEDEAQAVFHKDVVSYRENSHTKEI
ncbi:MAG: nucleoside deaminase [Gammaproteobacteria bacterium]|nr:nucleoside deaminase [Gammaproteobacteria bacterium]